MKKLLIFYVLVFVDSCGINSQASVDTPDTAAKLEAVIPKFYELKDEQWQAWQKIQQEWLKVEYPKILQAQKLKMNCNGCENIYMDAVFAINEQGKLHHYDVVNSKKCADKFSKALVERFTQWFFRVQFPPTLYHLNFEVRLGTGLSC